MRLMPSPQLQLDRRPRARAMRARLPQICVISRIPGLRAALDARGVSTAGMEWHAELDSPAAQQSLARCEVVRHAENSLTQPSASWLSGGSSQRQVTPQTAPSVGQLGQSAGQAALAGHIGRVFSTGHQARPLSSVSASSEKAWCRTYIRERSPVR